MKINKIIKGGAIAAFVALIVTAPAFAFDKSCVGEGSSYPNLSTTKSDTYPVACPIRVDGEQLYGTNSGACAQAGALSSNPDSCSSSDLSSIISTIVNTLIFVIGIVAVIMIILGGISYATSQGDPAKVKKGKDTILYGVIGLIVALLAYAIVTFVLNAING